MRKDLNAPKLPFVIGVIGVIGVAGPTADYDQPRYKVVHQNFRDATIRILGAGERTEIRNKTSGDESVRKPEELEGRGVIPRMTNGGQIQIHKASSP